MKKSWTYILKCSDSTFYTGCTTNLNQRMTQHKEGLYDGYTKRRRPVRLVWFEEFGDINEAIESERQIKNWSQAKKRALIRGDIESLKKLAQSKEMRVRRKRR
ncbi:MAG: GIY-YIG nuclease family protein [Bacteroidetes bacterium]|nr:GIY-YIG nuclease family protein [Bacteroidota bacterium]